MILLQVNRNYTQANASDFKIQREYSYKFDITTIEELKTDIQFYPESTKYINIITGIY